MPLTSYDIKRLYVARDLAYNDISGDFSIDNDISGDFSIDPIITFTS